MHGHLNIKFKDINLKSYDSSSYRVMCSFAGNVVSCISAVQWIYVRILFVNDWLDTLN